jgi:hypothetical protein
VRIFAAAVENVDAMLVGVRVRSELCIQSELCCMRRATITSMYFTSSACRPGGGSGLLVDEYDGSFGLGRVFILHFFK